MVRRARSIVLVFAVRPICVLCAFSAPLLTYSRLSERTLSAVHFGIHRGRFGKAASFLGQSWAPTISHTVPWTRHDNAYTHDRKPYRTPPQQLTLSARTLAPCLSYSPVPLSFTDTLFVRKRKSSKCPTRSSSTNVAQICVHQRNY
jgi:hypothetical protein